MPRNSLSRLLLSLALCALLAPATLLAENDTAVDDTNAETALCLVCNVHDGETEPEPIVATAEYEGETYGFCSEGCRDKFVEAPVGYLPPKFPRPAPPFEAETLDGETFSSESLRGQWTLLDFWATWCPPCIDDLPKLSALHDRWAERGFAVVSVSIDEGSDAAKKVEAMIEEREATHPVYLDAKDAPAWAAYHVRTVPTQFLVDPAGRIVAQWTGTIDLEEVEAEIAQALGDG